MSDELQEVGLYHRFELLANPSKKALFCGSVASADAAEKLVGADYITTALPEVPGAWQYADLTPLLDRTLLLLADGTPDSRQDIGRLASRCASIGCAFQLIDATDRPVDWTVDDWTEGEIAFRKWAGGRLHDWEPPESAPERAMAAPEEPPPLDPADLPPAQEDAPASARRSRRPSLAVVNGNAVRAARPDADPLPAPMSEVALGKYFAEEYGQDWRHVKEWGQWFKWNADRWEADKTNQAERLAIEVTCQALQWAEAGVLSPKDRRQVTKKSTAWAVRDVAATQAPIAASVEQWDTDALLLGVPGGVIDLRDGRMLEPMREQYISKGCAVAPEHGKPALWLKYLNRTHDGNQEIIAYLQRYAGYCATGEIKEHALAFLYGTGRNGKGVFVETLRGILGDYARTADIKTFMEQKYAAHSTELARLQGARLVVTEEMPNGGRWDEARIKHITGGGMITAHFMRQDDFEFTPNFKLLIAANHKPMLRSVDEAIKARMHLVPFNLTIPPEERDKDLLVKLQAEWPQILGWVLDGCAEWLRGGLQVPQCILEATERYVESEDVLGQWLDECCERGSDLKMEGAAGYRNYAAWCEKQGESVQARRGWSNAMVERGFEPGKGAGGVRIFRGAELRVPDYDPPAAHYPYDG